jgi:type I restriction enzyme S subunit
MKFRRETEFQETEIGKIPREWKTVKLSSIARIIMGQSPPSDTYNREGLGMPFLQGKMEFGRMYPSPTTYTTQPLKIAEPNDILISVRAPVGDVNIAPYKVCIGRGLAAIRFNLKTANHMFYFYYFQYIKKQLETLGKGSTFKAITKKDLEELLIPLPPIKEQEKVSGILTMIDRTIELYHEEREGLERLKRGLMSELLTGRIRVREENGRLSFHRETEFQETEIGKIPRDWRTFSLKEAFELYKGTTPSTKDSKYWGGTIPFATPTDITAINDLNMIYLTKTEKYLTEEGIRSKNLRIVPRGSLLFTSRATIGYLAINKVDVTINQGVIALIPKRKDVNILYYYYYLLGMRKKFEELAGGSTYREISMAMFSKTVIPQPPLQEQNRIANILSTIDRAIELYHGERERLERLKRGLMDLLLTGKVRVVDGDVGS